MKHYVGICHGTGFRETFRSPVTPTPANCIYAAVIGPFRTKRGAEFMAKNGQGNPHCQCVSDAEKLGKLYA